jgi:hypothetical protein
MNQSPSSGGRVSGTRCGTRRAGSRGASGRGCRSSAGPPVSSSSTSRSLGRERSLVLRETRCQIQFEERGTHALKGVPEEWQLFAVAQRPAASIYSAILVIPGTASKARSKLMISPMS